jgi:23S rRNA (uridine2552-2'-O)-methyltransferase
MVKRTQSSREWLKEHFTDPYVKRAWAEGWRSRAVFKLEEIDRKEKLLKPGMVVLDLGSTPGAWSQYAKRRVGKNGTLIASDILPMEPIPGVDFIEGDFREESVFEAILAKVPPGGVDVVLSDMAPNLSGVDAIDKPRSLYLCELALDLANRALKPGGDVLIKTFQGTGFDVFVAEARKHYTRVKFAKPAASRSRSPELYLLARGRKAV